jgi:hypothetical protein
VRAAGFEPALFAISGRRLLPVGLRARSGGWCTDRTCVPLRARRPSKSVPYLSANHPDVAQHLGRGHEKVAEAESAKLKFGSVRR